MALLQNLGVLAFLAASLLVGVRLLLLWQRTRQLPELTIGLAFVLAGFIGGVLIHLATVLGSAALGHGAVATLHAGSLCLAVFTWRVFRPDHLWAGSLVATLAAGAGLALLGGSGYGSEGAARGGTLFWLGFVCRALPFGWAALESGLYYSRIRRRAQIGLADPGCGAAFPVLGRRQRLRFLDLVSERNRHRAGPRPQPGSAAAGALADRTGGRRRALVRVLSAER